MTERTPPIYDTHAHIIAADRSAYPPAESERDNPAAPFTVDDLIAGMDANGVSHACVVQRYFYYRTDNSYALHAGRSHPDRLVPVIMLDGRDSDAVTRLRGLAGEQHIGGIRFARTELDVDDTSWMNSPGVMRLWEVAAEMAMPVAFIMYEPHHSYNLPALDMIAGLFPELPIILDHVGTLHGATADVRAARLEPGYVPYIAAPDFGVTDALRSIMHRPNVRLKLTGINIDCLVDDAIDPAEFVRFVVDEFGADRLVCGSDIGQTRGPYERIIGGLRAATRLLSDSERSMVMHANASGLYRPAR